MSFYTSYNTSSDIVLNGSVLFVTSFTGGLISFIGCSLIYKRIKDQYQIVNYRNGRLSSLGATSTKFTFDSDNSENESEHESTKSVSLPDYNEYIQYWVIDRNHNHHKGVDEHIPFDFVEELTSNGLVYLTYLKDQKRFHYWSNNTVNYNILCTVARKFCITYGCVDYYLDGYEESKSDEEDGDETIREDGTNDSETDEDDYLFLKPKSSEVKDEDIDTSSTNGNQIEISEAEEEDEYIEERYGRYGDPRPTIPVPKHLVFINKGNLYELEYIRKKEEKRKQMDKWKNAMMNIGDGDNNNDHDNENNNDSISISKPIDGDMCNSYADFKDMLQAERKLLDIDGSVVHLKTPTPSPSPCSSPVQLNSLESVNK